MPFDNLSSEQVHIRGTIVTELNFKGVEAMEKIGLIGFESMGRFYAQRLLQADFTLTVMDIDPQKVERSRLEQI